jgi:hypothetical protein
MRARWKIVVLAAVVLVPGVQALMRHTTGLSAPRSQGSAVDQSLLVTWTPALRLSAPTEIPSRLTTRVTPDGVTLTQVGFKRDARKRTVTTCAGYLAAIGEGYFPLTSYEQGLAYPFTRDCYLLRDLQSARPAIRTVFGTSGWSTTALTELPPLWIIGTRPDGDRLPGALAAGMSWQTFTPTVRLVRIDRDTLAAEDDGAIYTLEILARADFNGDGVQDLAVLGSTGAKGGTLNYTRYTILTRCSPTDHIHMITNVREPWTIDGLRCP